MGLGVHPEFSVVKYGDVYKEVLGDEFPEETHIWGKGVLLSEGRQVEFGRGWVKKPGQVVVTKMMAAWQTLWWMPHFNSGLPSLHRPWGALRGVCHQPGLSRKCSWPTCGARKWLPQQTAGGWNHTMLGESEMDFGTIRNHQVCLLALATALQNPHKVWLIQGWINCDSAWLSAPPTPAACFKSLAWTMRLPPIGSIGKPEKLLKSLSWNWMFVLIGGHPASPSNIYHNTWADQGYTQKTRPPDTEVTPNARGLMHLVSSRHCSHTLDTTKVVPKDGSQSGLGCPEMLWICCLCDFALREVLDPGDDAIGAQYTIMECNGTISCGMEFSNDLTC